jgi:hypothetical protein
MHHPPLAGSPELLDLSPDGRCHYRYKRQQLQWFSGRAARMRRAHEAEQRREAAAAKLARLSPDNVAELPGKRGVVLEWRQLAAWGTSRRVFIAADPSIAPPSDDEYIHFAWRFFVAEEFDMNDVGIAAHGAVLDVLVNSPSGAVERNDDRFATGRAGVGPFVGGSRTFLSVSFHCGAERRL